MTTDLLVAPSKGKCLSNVGSFVNQYQANAQTLANSLGNGVTAAEVLAVAGNESTYGTSSFAAFENFFDPNSSEDFDDARHLWPHRLSRTVPEMVEIGLLDRYERPMPVMTNYDQLLGKAVIA